MLFLKTLRSVSQNELQASGYRAQDLAASAAQGIPVASSVVVLSNAFDEILRLNNLKYKIDYILSYAVAGNPQSLNNAYAGIRKAILDAKYPPGFETELKELYESISQPLQVGELIASNEQRPVRIILSPNILLDPENNDTIIQGVNDAEELLQAVKEAWALAYSPRVLEARLREKYPENRLKLAIIVQEMSEPVTTAVAYSCMSQDRSKVFIQTYYGHLDLRGEIVKDYYAIDRSFLSIVASEIKPQGSMIERDDLGQLKTVPLAGKSASEKVIDRDLLELARLAKKTERLTQAPVKCFFTSRHDEHELLWCNRQPFQIMLEPETQKSVAQNSSSGVNNSHSGVQNSSESKKVEPHHEQKKEHVEHKKHEEKPEIKKEEKKEEPSADDFILAEEPSVVEQMLGTEPESEEPEAGEELGKSAPQQVSTIIAAEKPVEAHHTAPEGKTASLLSASLEIVRQIVERKYQAIGGQPADLASMIKHLNSQQHFSKNVDGDLLLRAEALGKANGTMPESDYAKAMEEITFLMQQA